jgi:hypothetical protein
MLAVLAVTLMVLTGVIYWAAGHLHQGNYWADRICVGAQGLCDRPLLLLTATAAVLALALLLRLLKAGSPQ